MAEGKEIIPYCNMLILGEGEAGKTSLLRQLVQLPYMEHMERTRGIVNQTVDTVEKSSLDTSSDRWRVKEDSEGSDQFSNALAGNLVHQLPRSNLATPVSEEDLKMKLEAIKRDLQTEEKSSNDVVEEQLASPAQQESVDFTDYSEIQSSSNPSKSPEGKSNPLPKNAGLDEIVTPSESPNSSIAMLDLRETQKIDSIVSQKQSYQKKEPSVVLNALDFAGQDMYRPMHHCFISKRAVYTVVFRLPDMRDYIKGVKKHNPLVDVIFWVRSIHAHTCLSKVKEEESARVLLVGTCRDELPNKSVDLKEIDTFIKKSLMSDVDKPYINYIYTAPNPCGVTYFVPVENSVDIISKGESYLEESGTKLVQDTIISMSKRMPFMKESHPIKWLKFEDRLKLYRSDRKLCPIVKVSDVKEVATQCGITDPQQQELALKFFHDTGKISWLSKF